MENPERKILGSHGESVVLENEGQAVGHLLISQRPLQLSRRSCKHRKTPTQTTEMMPSKCHRAIGFAFAKSYAWKIRQVSLANSHMTRFLQKFFPCFSATVAAISEISTVLRTALPRAESPRSMPCKLQIIDLHS